MFALFSFCSTQLCSVGFSFLFSLLCAFLWCNVAQKEACATANAKLASLDEPSFDSLISSGELGPLCQAEGKADGCRCQAALLARFWEVERAFT